MHFSRKSSLLVFFALSLLAALLILPALHPAPACPGPALGWPSTGQENPEARIAPAVSVAGEAGEAMVSASTTPGYGDTVPAPSISSLLPNSGPPLSMVKIYGSGFGNYGDSSFVTFGTVTLQPSHIALWLDYEIDCKVPPGLPPGPVEVRVTVNGVASGPAVFTVTGPPSSGWRFQDSGTNMTLYSVSMVDSLTAWAVGERGTILKTVDGGATWVPQSSGTEKKLLAVAAANPQVAWAGGEEILLLTVNGGATWNVVSAQPGYWVYDIAAPDADNCWVVGGGPSGYSGRGFIIRTRNRGASWELQLLNHRCSMYSLAAINGDQAWVAGADLAYSYGVILRTTDGGTTWNTVGPSDRNWTCVAACDAHNAMVWGYLQTQTVPPMVYQDCRKTSDGGATWDFANIYQAPFMPSQGCGAVMLSPTNIWIAGARPNHSSSVSEILRSTDGALSWSHQIQDYPASYAFDLSTRDGVTAWAVGYGGLILHTVDGGYMVSAPVMDSISPNWGESGTEVTIQGRGFGPSQGNSTVTFLVSPATVVSWSDTRIVCKAPLLPGTDFWVPVFVTTPGGTSNPLYFHYGKGFSIRAIEPAQGSQLSFLVNATVTGTGFQPGAAVRLEKGGVVVNALSVNVVSTDRIDCTLPLWGVEPGTYDVVVTNPGGSQARLAGGFTVTSPCGTGSGTALLSLGLTMGFLSLAGSWRARRRRTKPPRSG